MPGGDAFWQPTGLADHLADTSDAHDASAISYAGGTGMAATDVEAALDELATEKADWAGGTFTGDISVPDEAYDATTWNGSVEVPTKNAVRDKIETLAAGSVSDAAYGAGWDGDTTVAPSKNAVYDKIETITAVTPKRARVRRTTNQSITSGAATAISFDAERWDNDTIHDNSTNPTRLTATTAGLYEIGGCIRFANNANGLREAAIRLNGTTLIAVTRVDNLGASEDIIITLSTQYELAATDYVELMASHAAGTSLNVLVVANYSPEFWMTRLGA